MLRPRQIVICGSLAVAFWVLATLSIRFNPSAVAAGLRGDINFITSIPVCWLSVWLICRLAKLEPSQILAGCMVVLADAMLIDAVALRWFHTVYTVNDQIGRSGAAWLLWGYGVSAWIALIVAERRARISGTPLLLRPAGN